MHPIRTSFWKSDFDHENFGRELLRWGGQSPVGFQSHGMSLPHQGREVASGPCHVWPMICRSPQCLQAGAAHGSPPAFPGQHSVCWNILPQLFSLPLLPATLGNLSFNIVFCSPSWLSRSHSGLFKDATLNINNLYFVGLAPVLVCFGWHRNYYR